MKLRRKRVNYSGSISNLAFFSENIVRPLVATNINSAQKQNVNAFLGGDRRNSSLLKINISEQKETTVRHREGKTQGQPLSPASRRSIRSPWDFREQQTVSLNREDFSCMSHHSGILNEVCLHGCTLSKSHN